MDAFYASVEQRDNPSWQGKPVVVGGSAKGRGVVSAASYEARKFGIHSAMSAYRAVQLCPHAIFVKPRIDHYAAVSKEIHQIFEEFTPLIEPISLDEAFLDVSGSIRLHGSAEHIGRSIKHRIREEVKLIASVGLAPNKFLAKIASDLKKPDGFVVVEQDRIHEFLDPLPISRIWGIGKVTDKRFRKYSVTTIGQLRQLPLDVVKSWFGSAGDHYWKLAHGVDFRSVVPDRDAKSISNETTFSEDISDPELLSAWLIMLVEQVGRRLRRQGKLGRTVDIKVRFSDFKTITRSKTLSQSTNITEELIQYALDLLHQRTPLLNAPIRLLGFGVSGFDDSELTQLQLFHEEDRQRQREIDTVADQIAAKFGKHALHRGTGYHGINKQSKSRSGTPEIDPTDTNKP